MAGNGLMPTSPPRQTARPWRTSEPHSGVSAPTRVRFWPYADGAAWPTSPRGTVALVQTTDETADFTALSQELTGFDEATLRGTGLTGTYLAVAAEQLGPDRLRRLLEATGGPLGELDDDLRDAARALTHLWYTGSWPGPSPFVVSARAYAEGLVWKAAGLTAPATAPGGYGSWADSPSTSHSREGSR